MRSRKDSSIIFLEAKTNYHSPSAFATYPSAAQGALGIQEHKAMKPGTGLFTMSGSELPGTSVQGRRSCVLAVRERSSRLFIVNVLCTARSAHGGQKRGVGPLELE